MLRITSFRRGKHTQKDNQVIADAGSAAEAGKLLGKGVAWSSSAGKKIRGKVACLHGSKGKVRVLMDKGLPGQAVGGELLLVA